MELKFLLSESIACAGSRANAFESTSGMIFFGEAISLVTSRIVFENVLLIGWLIEKIGPCSGADRICVLI